MVGRCRGQSAVELKRAKSDRFISQRQSGKRCGGGWTLGPLSEERRESLGAANRGATRNIAREPLFHPLKENWQNARRDESVREKEREREREREREAWQDIMAQSFFES